MMRARPYALFAVTVLAVWLGGCAVAPVATPEKPFEVAQYPAPGGVSGTLGEYAGSDSASLTYVSYTQPSATTALVYLHGIESHAGWFALANALVFGLVSLRYFSGGIPAITPLSAIYLVAVYIGHHVLLTVVPLFLLASPVILLVPRRRAVSQPSPILTPRPATTRLCMLP